MNEPFTGGVLERDATRAPRFPRARSRSRIFIFTAKLCLDLVAAMLPARRKLGQKILPAPQLARLLGAGAALHPGFERGPGLRHADARLGREEPRRERGAEGILDGAQVPEDADVEPAARGSAAAPGAHRLEDYAGPRVQALG